MGCNFSKKAVKIVSRKASDCTTNNNASTPGKFELRLFGDN